MSKRAFASLKRVIRILKTKSKINSVEAPVSIPDGHNAPPAIIFDQVSFHYEDSTCPRESEPETHAIHENVLDEVSFQLNSERGPGTIGSDRQRKDDPHPPLYSVFTIPKTGTIQYDCGEMGQEIQNIPLQISPQSNRDGQLRTLNYSMPASGTI